MSVLRFLKLGFLGARAIVQSLADRFDDLLSSEETAGNDNVFYNPQDLTSLRVGRDGSGGSPAVGDPVGMMLDTSGLSGSMEEFLSSQPELITNGTFDTDTSGWNIVNADLAAVSGELQISNQSSSPVSATQSILLTVGKTYAVTVTSRLGGSGGSTARASIYGNIFATATSATPVTETIHIVATSSSATLALFSYGTSSTEAYFDNISVKEIPGNHAIAPTDAARPTLMDDPDTTWSSLTDDGTRTEVMPSDPSAWSLAAGHSFSGGTWVFSAAGGTSIYTHNGALDESSSPSPFNAELVDLGGLGGQTFPITYTVLSTTQTFQRGKQGTVYETTVTLFDPVDQGSWPTGRLQIFLYNGKLELKTLNGLQCSANISVRKVNTAFDERGDDYVVNGGFDTDSDWTASDGSTISGGVLNVADGVINEDIRNTGATAFPQDKTAEVVFTISESTANFGVRVALYHVGGSIQAYAESGAYFTANGTYRLILPAGLSAQNYYIGFRRVSAHTGTLKIDNVSLREVLTPNLLLTSAGDDDSTFDTDTGNWGKDAGISIGSGVATFNTAGSGDLYYTGLLTIDKWYKVTFYVSRYVSGTIRLNAQRDDTGLAPIITPAVGWYTLYGRAVATLFKIGSSVASDYDIDNVIVQELPSTTPTSYYLDTDGTDDWMQVTPTLNLGEQWWHTGAWQVDTEFRYPFSTSEDARGGLSRNANRWAWFDTSGTAVFEIAPGSPGDLSVLTIEQHDTNSISGRTNGVPGVTNTPYDDSALTQGLVLFARENDAAGSPLDGRFYGGAWGQGQVDYAELTTLQDYLGTLVEPDINPTDVTSYANVYEMLSAQTAAALFDIDDTTSLRVGRDGSGGVPVDGDPVGLMMDVSGAGGSTMAAYLEGATELVTNGTFDTDISGWTLGGTAGAGDSIQWNSGVLEVTRTTNNISAYQAISTTIGAAYKVVLGDVSDSFSRLSVGTSTTVPTDNLIGAGEFIFVATATTHYVHLRSAAIATQTFDNISVKALPGYVATAPSDAARPTLRTDNSPISSREVLTTTFGWNITDGGRA